MHGCEGLTGEGLPEAGSAFIASELRVGLKTDLALEGRFDLTLVRAISAGEEGAAKLCLDEELSVEGKRRRVERSSCRNTYRTQQSSQGIPKQLTGNGRVH